LTCVQLDVEDVAGRNTRALGESHEGLGFTSTGIEDVDVLGLEPRVGWWIRDLQRPEDLGNGLGGRKEVALLD
jgi:hypothetical protein